MSALVIQAVQETVKALLPYMLGAEAPETVKLRRKRVPVGMDALDAGVRQEAEDMLLAGRYTYSEIREHLYQIYGARISHSAFGRYAIKVRERAALLGEYTPGSPLLSPFEGRDDPFAPTAKMAERRRQGEFSPA